MDAAELEQTLRANGIPPRPAALEVIGRELHRDDQDLRVLGRALHGDVALAAGVVKTANSAAFGLRRRVRTILEGIEVMGLRTLGQVVACVSLQNAFPNLHLERFWDSSMKVATLSSWLVKTRSWKGISAEDAYTFGLFRDCGIAVLLQRFPDYADVLRVANREPQRPFTEIEEGHLPLNHAQVGAMLAQTWWLPTEVTEGVRYHHDPRAIEPDSRFPGLHARSGILIAISQVAEHLYQAATGLAATMEWQKLGPACLARLEIGAGELPDLALRGREVLAA